MIQSIPKEKQRLNALRRQFFEKLSGSILNVLVDVLSLEQACNGLPGDPAKQNEMARQIYDDWMSDLLANGELEALELARLMYLRLCDWLAATLPAFHGIRTEDL